MFYVPPGHSIVVSAPARTEKSEGRKLVLTGDDHDFDNTLYIAPHLQQEVNILYIGGDDPNDPKEMLFYIRRAFGATGVLKPHVISRPGDKALGPGDIETSDLIIMADSTSERNIGSLRRHVESGRTLLVAMKSADAVETVAGLAGIDGLEAKEADVDQYAMLGRIEFSHPVLAPFSEPRFGDFTKIHFWKYRRLDISDWPGAAVLAWFDSDVPALFEVPAGKGSLLVLTCGWHPADSQLALSSKFVPLLYSILEYGGVLTGRQLQYFVGDSVPIPPRAASGSEEIEIHKPDDSLISIEAAKQTFTQTDLPGVYSVESSAQSRSFAVNLAAGECRTAPVPTEEIEKLGVSLEQSSGAAVERTERVKRQANLARMEYEQKLWRRLLVALLTVLLIEIWLAGRLTRRGPVSQGEQK